MVIVSRQEDKLKELKDSIPECALIYKAADATKYEGLENRNLMNIEIL